MCESDTGSIHIKKVALFAAAAGMVAFTGTAFAGATFEIKGKGTKSQGSCVGQASSAGTGNGAVIGGNGTQGDQTTPPGSRAAEVHAVQQNCQQTPD